MKKMMMYCAIVWTGTIFAEQMGNIEYTLPETAKTWTVTEIENADVKATMYMHADPLQTFGVMSSSIVLKEEDTGAEKWLPALRSQMETMLPDAEVDVRVVETDKKSISYKVDIKEKETHTVGYGRGFFTETGCVLLYYQAVGDQVDPLWINTMKAATFVE